ncbi:MAG: sulfite exporter TauE/SafE family protein [Oligoflexia bacterium]|nr:sulfite exporter TauE/SafE family protein [Oligoflexia bacterium]
MNNIFIQMLAAFGAGLGTSFTPCVYPMLPITLGYLGARGSNGVDNKKRVFGFITGQVIAFTALGVVAVTLGEFLGFSSEIPWVQILVGFVLILSAGFSFFEKLPKFFYKINALSSFGSANSYWGAVLVGISAALVASPCTSPILGAVLTTIAQVENRFFGVFLMFLYAVGLSSLFLLIGLGLAKLTNLPRAGVWLKKVHFVSSLLLVLGGLYFIIKGIQLL